MVVVLHFQTGTGFPKELVFLAEVKCPFHHTIIENSKFVASFFLLYSSRSPLVFKLSINDQIPLTLSNFNFSSLPRYISRTTATMKADSQEIPMCL